MNRITVLLICFCGIFFEARSQAKTYTFRKARTAQVLAKYNAGSFAVYEVIKKDFTIPLYDTITVLSERYAEIERSIEKLRADSVAAFSEYHEQLKRYDTLELTIIRIRNFIRSEAKFKRKSYLLAAAQNSLDHYQLDYLVYADGSTDIRKRKDFTAMRLNERDFHSHLQRTAQLIELNNKKAYDGKIRNVESAIKAERAKQLTMHKYEVKLRESEKVKTLSGLGIKKEVSNADSIEGTFEHLGHYAQVSKTKGNYAAGQLVEATILEREKVSSQGLYGLIHDPETNKFYLDAGQISFIGECGTPQSNQDVIDAIEKAGFKTSFEKGEHRIHTTHGNIWLTDDVFAEVQKNNTKYVNEIALSVKTFNALLGEALPMTEKLINHFNAHRGGTMTEARLVTWKQDVAKADAILNKMGSLKGAERENIINFNYQIATDRLGKYNDFFAVVMGSKQILGM